MKDNRITYSVSELNQTIKSLLETGLPSLLVEGEISQFTAHRSGHWYFSIKDAKSSVDCVMFKSSNARARLLPKVGDHIIVRARAGLYPASGRFQLTIESLREAGEGDLQAAFLTLKEKLKNEGLFAPSAKQALPETPHSIAVVTSSTGAAIADVTKVLKRRFPVAPVTLYPTAVQGDGAEKEIIIALKKADNNNHDVILLVRGGGSMEDLWTFNDEQLARCVFACNTPVISGVGHEVDTTIVDFVVDLRAPTPSAAAELATPDIQMLMQQHDGHFEAASRALQHKLSQLKQQLQSYRLKLETQHPNKHLGVLIEKTTQSQAKLHHAIYTKLQNKKDHLNATTLKLTRHNPRHKLELASNRLDKHQAHLKALITQHLEAIQHALAKQSQAMHLVSPLNVLARGYSVARKDKKLISNSVEVQSGERINITLNQGSLDCDVVKTNT